MKLSKDQRRRLDHLNSHSAPVSRRDFLSLGFIGVTGMALLPKWGWASSLHQTAMSSATPAFLVIDLAGGAGLAGNFLVGNKGGAEDLLTSYDQLGWNPRQGVDKRFGLPMAPASVSKIFEGIATLASPKAQANFRMGSLLHSSIDDTSSNVASALWLASKYNSQFSRIISQGMSQISSQSGGNAQAALADMSLKPVTVNSLTDFLNGFGFSGNIGALDASRRGFLFDKIAKISKTQMGSLSARNRDQLLNGFGTAMKGLNDFSNFDTKVMDPRFNADAREIFGLTEASVPTASNVIISSIAYNTLKGNTGPGVITIGGCDYHDGSSTSGDAKDLEIGQTIGRIVEMAHRLQRPLFLQIISDGGVYSNPGTRNWQGDAGSKSMSVIGLYDPKAAPRLIKKDRYQIGSYTNGQGVERTSLIGDSPTLAAIAAFANYLSATGKIGELEKYVPRGTFSDDQIEDLLIFDSIG
jgi:hypothetical protein